MRFDDMLTTLLRQRLDTPAARLTAWRQAIDMLAQGRDGEIADAASDMLRGLRAEVPLAQRADTAAALAGRRVSAALVRLFADDAPAVAAPALGGVALAPADWIALLPELSPTARGFVRNRRDLPPEVRRALDGFGASDLVLHAPPAEAVEAQPGATAIGDVVARIEAFRRRRSGADEGAAVVVPPPIAFRFETDAGGDIVWTDASPRGGLIGANIARLAGGDGQGVDGHAAGAVRRRAPFRDARLVLGSGGAFAGSWRISAVPLFDEDSGRFTGYRGGARRPRADESAAPAEAGPFGPDLHPDALRQLVHELRTPINAIVGFAEMIEGQMLGPAGAAYRVRARGIAGEGRRLLDAVDDLDAAARIAGRRWTTGGGPTDMAGLVARAVSDATPGARARGAAFALDLRANPPVAADAPAAERMIGRLVQAVAGLAADETIAVALAAVPGGTELTLGRPRALAGREERALLDPGYAPDGDWPDAPLLGLGFALRLVRNLAGAAGGTLAIEADRFRLRLPMSADSAGAGGGQG